MNDSQGFIHIYRPPQNGSKRTILVLHGTGGDENSLLPIAGALDPDAGALSVRGKINENGANRFFRRFAEGVFDLEDLRFRTQELADFVKSAAAEYGFDLDQVAAVGYSNGANIAASLLLLRPESIGKALLFRAMVPFEPEQKQDLTTKQVFLSEGSRDEIVPVDNAERLAAMLREQGAKVHLRWNDLGHSLARAEIDAAREWLNGS